MQAERHIAGYNIPFTLERVAVAAGVSLMAAGAAFVAYFDPSTTHILPVCPLYAATGFACPGCGLTRGFHALFHGDVLTALHFNALIPIWGLIFGYLWVSLVMLAVRGKGLPLRFVRPSFLFGFMAVMILFGALRNVPMWPFTILFP
jgi:Protein of unknown function (DUF2752)